MNDKNYKKVSLKIYNMCKKTNKKRLKYTIYRWIKDRKLQEFVWNTYSMCKIKKKTKSHKI